MDCLESTFRGAIKEKGAFSPPSCCGLIQLHTVLDRLDSKTASEYRRKFKEWMTKNKVYCPVPTCSAFIAPEDIELEKSSTITGFECPSCKTDICGKCHQLSHGEDSCDLSTKAEEAALLARFKIKQCPRCSCAIKKMHGCPHMVCACGAHFCWYCERSTDRCYGDCEGREDIENEEEQGDEDDAADSVNDDDTRASSGNAQPDETNEPKLENDIAADSETQDENFLALSMQRPGPPRQPFSLPPRPAPLVHQDALSTGPIVPLTAREIVDEASRISAAARRITATDRQADEAAQEALRQELARLNERRRDRIINRRAANLRPANLRPHDLDAGGEARWANSDEDFGEEPGDEPSGQVWSCLHQFHIYYDKCSLNRGNLDLMECNRCFSRVTPAPVEVASESPEAKRRKRSNSDAVTPRSIVGGLKPNQTLLCPRCCMVACQTCQRKYDDEEAKK